MLCGGLPDGLPPETYATFATYAAEAGVPVVLDAGGAALWHAVARHPVLAVPEPGAPGPRPAWQDARCDGDPAALMAAGAGAVATMSGDTVERAHGQRPVAGPAGRRSGRAATMSRDALVAGFVPGVALGWDWPDSVRHAVSLAASAGRDGVIDLVTYEELLAEVTISRLGG